MARIRLRGLLTAALAVAGASATAAFATPEPAASTTIAALERAAAPKPAYVVKGSRNVRALVSRFGRLLGPDNESGPPAASGRRVLTWDGVPDEHAAPNPLPGDFFLARGALLSTPGDHVAVSADADNPYGVPVRFGDVNPTYPRQFRAFSPERLFSPIGSNVVNLRFTVPGTRKPALVTGFGAVYTDVDRPGGAEFQYFDASGHSLGKYAVPRSPSSLSFLGVVFRKPIVARVRIVYGTSALGPRDSRRYDVAVMDDFLYGEPQPRG